MIYNNDDAPTRALRVLAAAVGAEPTGKLSKKLCFEKLTHKIMGLLHENVAQKLFLTANNATEF